MCCECDFFHIGINPENDVYYECNCKDCPTLEPIPEETACHFSKKKGGA